MIVRTGYRGGTVLFSLPFMAIGAWLALTGFEVVPPPSKVNAPLWVISAIGISFFVAGLIACVRGLFGMVHHARRRRIIEFQPERPWLADYPWDPSGIDSRLGARAWQSVVGVTFLCMFLTPFHWWAWMSDAGNLFVKFITGIFQLAAVFAAYSAVRYCLQWLKYGRLRLRFRTFPFEPGGRVDVDFPNRFDKFQATLRFVEEKVVTTGSGKNRTTRTVYEALHEERREFTPGALDPEVRIRFDLPDGEQWSNDISGTPVR